MIRKSSSDIIKINRYKNFYVTSRIGYYFFFLHIILRIDIMKRLLNLLKYFFYLLIKLLIV